jgi:AP-2 complex subunit alpha
VCVSYLGLENMGRLSMLPQVSAAVKRNQAQIAESLHDPDISIRRRALDLLYGMCDCKNAQAVVQELLDYLVVSDFAIREELVLKIAILAEKYAPTQRWYVDVVLTMMDKAGDYVSDDIWHAGPALSFIACVCNPARVALLTRHRAALAAGTASSRL